MKKINIKQMAIYSIVAALYVALTLTLSPIAFSAIQFRFAEALILLCFFNKKYSIPLILGCFISNLASPLGWPDIVFGTLATILAVIGVMYSKNIVVASIFPVVCNAVIVGLELTFVFNGSFDWLLFGTNAICVAIGEIVTVSILGVMLFAILRRNEKFMELIDANQNVKKTA